MKKLIGLLLILVVAIGVNAQEIERPSSSTYNTFSKNDQKPKYSYWNYTGVATDLLVPTTSDTIDIRYHVKKHVPYSIYLISKFNPILLADTIVYINVLGRNSENESWASIISDSSAAVTADGIVKSVSSGTAPTYTATIAAYNSTIAATQDTIPSFYAVADTSGAGSIDSLTYDSLFIDRAAQTIANAQQTITLTETSTFQEYRYLLVRYILAGNDATGTGIELVQSELKLFEH